MKISRSNLVALITGIVSVFICIAYLLLITVFDFRTFLNDRLTILSQNLEVITFGIDNLS